MCAIKNNKIIIKGYRNLKDGLWDIPIKKSTITTQCCESPPMHPSLYPKRHPNKNTRKTGQKYPKVSNSVANHLKNLSQLAISNYWDSEIEKQTKINIKSAKDHKANVILRKKQTHVELATYLHAACYSPVPSTFIKAIKKGHFKTWPGLTPEIISKHLSSSLSTIKGHIVQER